MSRPPTRFELLEVDDHPTQPTPIQRIEQETETERRRRAEELAHIESLARAKRAEAEAARQLNEVMSARSSRVAEMTEKRRARTRARHSKKTAMNRVNDKLHEIGRKYWPSVQDAYEAAIAAVRQEGFVDTGEVSEGVGRDGNHPRVYGVEDDEGKIFGLFFSDYRMQSGRYEIVTYLS